MMESKTRKLTITEQIDAYFNQDDDSMLSMDDEHITNDLSLMHSVNSVDETAETNKLKGNEQDFMFRHTVSYWISISFIFGSLLFCTGSIFSSIQSSLRENDQFVLITVAYFAASTSFLIASFFGLFEVIRVQKNQYQRKFSVNYWTALFFVIGSVFYQITLTLNLLQVKFDKDSFAHYLWLKVPILAGGICFFVGGLGEMYLNDCMRCRPYNLGWIISWLNGIGGFFFLISGFGIFFDESSFFSFYFSHIPYIIGSFSYFFGSIGSLLMWKLHQFGLVYLPKLNKNYVYFKNKTVKMKKGMILYRDIFFLVFYVGTAASGITALSYSLLCRKYADWFKNFLAATLGSIALLSVGSIMHIEPEKKPYSYLTWFLRFYMVCYTVNLLIDSYHLSGAQCDHYGKH